MGVTLPREKINGWREDRTPIASTQVDGRYYAVVIGCNQDWPDDRKKYGDIGEMGDSGQTKAKTHQPTHLSVDLRSGGNTSSQQPLKCGGGLR